MAVEPFTKCLWIVVGKCVLLHFKKYIAVIVFLLCALKKTIGLCRGLRETLLNFNF